MHIHTYASSCLLESGMKMTHDTHLYPSSIAYTNTHTSLAHFRECFSYIHVQVVLYCWVGWRRQTRIPVPTLDCLHKQTYTLWRVPLSYIQERFPYAHAALHVTLHTYFTNVGRVLIQIVVLQTVLWDIRGWIIRFLVYFCRWICCRYAIAVSV